MGNPAKLGDFTGVGLPHLPVDVKILLQIGADKLGVMGGKLRQFGAEKGVGEIDPVAGQPSLTQVGAETDLALIAGQIRSHHQRLADLPAVVGERDIGQIFAGPLGGEGKAGMKMAVEQHPVLSDLLINGVADQAAAAGPQIAGGLADADQRRPSVDHQGNHGFAAITGQPVAPGVIHRPQYQFGPAISQLQSLGGHRNHLAETLRAGLKNQTPAGKLPFQQLDITLLLTQQHRDLAQPPPLIRSLHGNLPAQAQAGKLGGQGQAGRCPFMQSDQQKQGRDQQQNHSDQDVEGQGSIGFFLPFFDGIKGHGKLRAAEYSG